MKKIGDSLDSTLKVLYEEYNQLVMRIACNVLRDKELAKDAFQAAFLCIAQNTDKVPGSPDKKEKYIRRIARNVAIDIYRKNKKIKQSEIPLIDSCDTDEKDNGKKKSSIKELSVESFENSILRKYDIIWLYESLDKLDTKDSEYIKEYYFEELPITQIAEKHGISVEAAYKRVYRSLDRLRKIFMKQEAWNEKRNQ